LRVHSPQLIAATPAEPKVALELTPAQNDSNLDNQTK
jgi:hypothetical protein